MAYDAGSFSISGEGSGPTPSPADADLGAPKKPPSWINGGPLSSLEWLTNSLTVPPSLHRLSNAFGLTTGLLSGMMIADNAMGYAMRDGSKVKVEQYHRMLKPVMKPFHNVLGEKLNYNFHGADERNRVLKVAHFAIPAVLGLAGNMAGSSWYFRKREQQAEHAEFIDDYSKKIALDQSKPWLWMSGVTALGNVGIGLNFLPFSYGMNMGMRFTLASDRRITLPGFKAFLSNNHSYYPLGPSSLRDYFINYLVHNPSKEPAQMEGIAHAILEPWFGPQSHEVCQEFAGKALAIRNQFFEEGGVPKEKQAACKAALEKEYKGLGLHQTLADLGLDVLNARINDTGWMGHFAEHVGAKAAVTRDLDAFHAKEIARRREHPELMPKPPGAIVHTADALREKIAEPAQTTARA